MPDEVKRYFGVALFAAQVGSKHPDAKPMKGFSGSGVLEIVEDYNTDTYRAVYTVRYVDAVYVLHVFQKKSKKKYCHTAGRNSENQDAAWCR